MDRMQEWPSGTSRSIRTVGGVLKRLLTPELVILLAGSSLLLVLAIFYARYSPVLRWLLLILFLFLLGWIAGKYVYLRTVKVEPLGLGKPQRKLQKGDLASLSASLRRGVHGMRYSQLAFAIDVRDAFLEKIRAESGFQEDDEELKDDMSRLAVLCEDKELFRFLEKTSFLERSMADVLSSSEEIFLGEPQDFESRMKMIIMKMEAWP